MRWIALSQTVAFVAGSVVLPFYVVVLEKMTGSYSAFAFLYALFAFASALTHWYIDELTKRVSIRSILIGSNLASGLALFLVPLVPSLSVMYFIQVILGISMALQKSGEKIAVAQATSEETRNEKIGKYHAFTSLISALALMVTGVFLDIFSLVFLFYIVAFWFLIAALLSSKIRL